MKWEGRERKPQSSNLTYALLYFTSASDTEKQHESQTSLCPCEYSKKELSEYKSETLPLGVILYHGVMSTRTPAIQPSIHPGIRPTIHPFIHPLFPLSSVTEQNNTNIYLPSLRYVLEYSCQCLKQQFMI